MAKLTYGEKWKRYGANALDYITGGIGDLSQRLQGPYTRVNERALKYTPTALLFGGIGDYDQAAELRNALRSEMSGDVLGWWDSLSAPEQDALLESYYEDIENGLHNTGFSETSQRFNKDQFLKDIAEYNAIEASPLLSNYVNVDSILADSQKAIDAENERLLASLNEDLASTSDAYNNARNELLAGQHQRNQMTVDTMASDMSRARRNAIEAGASAGIRIAGNVNSILSAQNKMSQQSLETSNQLAQMLVNQRNAEAGLRGQWRDIESSTYDRVQNRAQNEMNIGQQRYDQAHADWQRKYDTNVSESNALADSMLKHKDRNKSAYTSSGGSAY
jgi:hypothetical protein